MTATATKKKPALSLARLSAVAQIAVQSQPADAEIDLARLFSVKQVRREFRNLEELAASITLNGIVEPLVVHEEGDDRYRIIVGERRFRAAPLAGLSKIPVVIKKGLSELQIRRMQVTENHDREDPSAYDEAMGVIEDVEQYGTKEAMLIWNRGEAWVSKRMAVKRYADPVRELLEKELCGDFEVLHCLSQIYEAEDTHSEFNRLQQRMKDGSPVSRDESRNTLARLKAWNQQQADLAKRRDDLTRATKSKAPAPDKTPQKVQDQHTTPDVAERAAAERAATDDVAIGAQEAPNTSTAENRGMQNSPASAKSQEQKDAAEKQRAAEQLQTLRSELFEYGEAGLAQFRNMKSHMLQLGHGMHETEWALWHGFLAVALPMLEGIGPERAMAYLKKIQGELKGKAPMQLWDALHPDADGAGRDPCPEMPADWRF